MLAVAHWDMAETCDNGDMGTAVLCPSPALIGLAGAGRAPDWEVTPLKGAGGAALGADVGG